MPNVLKALRAEIRQLARSETKRTAKLLRGQIQTLRRNLTALERRLDRAGRTGASGSAGAATSGAGRRARFSPDLLKRHRAKVGLSRKAYAKLLGVSSLSIYFWETGRTKPRRDAVLAWQDLRQEGVRALRRRAGVPLTAAAKPGSRRAKPAAATKRAAKAARPRRAKPRRASKKRAAKGTARKKAVAKTKRRRVRRAGGSRRAARAKAA